MEHQRVESDDRFALLKEVRNHIEENRNFWETQEVESVNWRIPTTIYDALRDYTVGNYGTAQHIGAFVTEAMTAWTTPDEVDDRHARWMRLKTDYDWSDVDANIDDWNYKTYADYSDIPGDEKSQLNISIPRAVLRDFTRNLGKHQYGEELANAINAELRKRAQIAMMEGLLNELSSRHAEPSEVEALEAEFVTGGAPNNLADWRVDTTEARIGDGDALNALEACDDYKSRRGILAANLRTTPAVERKWVYNRSAKAGVSSRRSQKKDFGQIIDHIRASGDEEVLRLHPSERVRSKLDTLNLQQEANLWDSNQLADKDEMDFTEMGISIWSAERTTSADIWDDLLDELWENTEMVTDVDWKNAKNSVERVYRGVKQKRNLHALKRVLDAYRDELRDHYEFDDEDEKNTRLARLSVMITEVEDEIDGLPSDLERRYQHFKKEKRIAAEKAERRKGKTENQPTHGYEF